MAAFRLGLLKGDHERLKFDELRLKGEEHRMGSFL